MEIQIKTKFNVGDTVYCIHYPETYVHKGDFSLDVYEHTISMIKVIYNPNEEGFHIYYFMKGMTSYEGENWFKEGEPECMWFIDHYVYETREDAEEQLAIYNFKTSDKNEED